MVDKVLGWISEPYRSWFNFLGVVLQVIFGPIPFLGLDIVGSVGLAQTWFRRSCRIVRLGTLGIYSKK